MLLLMNVAIKLPFHRLPRIKASAAVAVARGRHYQTTIKSRDITRAIQGLVLAVAIAVILILPATGIHSTMTMPIMTTRITAKRQTKKEMIILTIIWDCCE